MLCWRKNEGVKRAGELASGAVPEGFRWGGGVWAVGVPILLTFMLANRADRGFWARRSSPARIRHQVGENQKPGWGGGGAGERRGLNSGVHMLLSFASANKAVEGFGAHCSSPAWSPNSSCMHQRQFLHAFLAEAGTAWKAPV